MTRIGIDTTLRSIFWVLGLVLLVALVAKLIGHVPGVAGTEADAIAKDVYTYLKEMAPVFITIIAAYLAGAFRKRSNFVESLAEEKPCGGVAQHRAHQINPVELFRKAISDNG